MCNNIKEITLDNVSKIKSVFTLSAAQKMSSLERLSIRFCDELEHMVVDIGDVSATTGVNIVFPKLKELIVFYCVKLEYIFGHINSSDHNQNHLQLPALIFLEFKYLPSLIGLGTKHYHTMLSHMEVISLIECP
jgi:hypothetical protein